MGGTYAERSGRGVCVASILGKCRNAQPNQQAQENHGRAAGQSVSRRVVLRDMRVFHILSDVGFIFCPVRSEKFGRRVVSTHTNQSSNQSSRLNLRAKGREPQTVRTR